MEKGKWQQDKIYDGVIVGGGPAGLTAAIYLARAECDAVVLEELGPGGQMAVSWEVANYPGVKKCGGYELADIMREQAESFGAKIYRAKVMEIEEENQVKVLHTSAGDIRAKGVILAPGGKPGKVGFEGEEEFFGRGISYCATCDGAFYRDRDVFVIGGGYAAAEESIFLARFARSVTMAVRRDRLSCAASLARRVENNEKIKIQYHTRIMAAGGEERVTWAEFYNSRTEEKKRYEDASGIGIFVLAGYEPDTKWLKSFVDRTEDGYIVTDRQQRTNLPGVFAAGDACVKKLRQIVTAAADGAVAATSLERYLEETDI